MRRETGLERAEQASVHDGKILRARDYRANNTRAAHTNADTCNHVLEEDMKQPAAVSAYVIYEPAGGDGKVARKPVPAQ